MSKKDKRDRNYSLIQIDNYGIIDLKEQSKFITKKELDSIVKFEDFELANLYKLKIKKLGLSNEKKNGVINDI